jgi:hypothetical protein
LGYIAPWGCPKRTDETDLTGTSGASEDQLAPLVPVKSVSSVLFGQPHVLTLVQRPVSSRVSSYPEGSIIVSKFTNRKIILDIIKNISYSIGALTNNPLVVYLYFVYRNLNPILPIPSSGIFFPIF